jgi:hypothetical protein
VPVNEVAKVSSNNLDAILSISLMPSPTVLPGARLEEIVADLYRLK